MKTAMSDQTRPAMIDEEKKSRTGQGKDSHVVIALARVDILVTVRRNEVVVVLLLLLLLRHGLAVLRQKIRSFLFICCLFFFSFTPKRQDDYAL